MSEIPPSWDLMLCNQNTIPPVRFIMIAYWVAFHTFSAHFASKTHRDANFISGHFLGPEVLNIIDTWEIHWGTESYSDIESISSIELPRWCVWNLKAVSENHCQQWGHFMQSVLLFWRHQEGYSLYDIESHHKITGLKMFVVVLPKNIQLIDTSLSKPSFGVTPTTELYSIVFTDYILQSVF